VRGKKLPELCRRAASGDGAAAAINRTIDCRYGNLLAALVR